MALFPVYTPDPDRIAALEARVLLASMTATEKPPCGAVVACPHCKPTHKA